MKTIKKTIAKSLLLFLLVLFTVTACGDGSGGGGNLHGDSAITNDDSATIWDQSN